MNAADAMRTVRGCIAAIKPDADLASVRDDTPLLKERVITSLDIVDLLLHLEAETGRGIRRDQLQPGSFRDIATIARVFVLDGGES